MKGENIFSMISEIYLFSLIFWTSMLTKLCLNLEYDTSVRGSPMYLNNLCGAYESEKARKRYIGILR